MKKIVASVLAVLLFCAALSGCGSDRMENGAVLPGTTPMIDPSMSPTLEDGIVDDTDGFIGDDADRTGASDSGIIDGGTAGGDTAVGAPGSSGTGADTGSTGSTGGSSVASPSPTVPAVR